MRVLHVHNFYQLPGGEDQCFATTGVMLENYGHEVIRYTLHNDTIADMGALAAASRLLNSSVYDELRRTIRKHRPDVAHFENIFPLVSPAAYYACRSQRVPVVQTLTTTAWLASQPSSIETALCARNAWAKNCVARGSARLLSRSGSAAQWWPRRSACTAPPGHKTGKLTPISP